MGLGLELVFGFVPPSWASRWQPIRSIATFDTLEMFACDVLHVFPSVVQF